MKRAVCKTGKWGGLVLTALLLLVWNWSAWHYIVWYSSNNGVVEVDSARLLVHSPPVGLPWGPFAGVEKAWKPFSLEWGFEWSSSARGISFTVPLWFPFLLTLLATALAWWADLKYARCALAGNCPKCGYGRAGLPAAGLCPECGQGTQGSLMPEEG